MMKKTLNVDAEYRRFKGMKAVESFCRKHNREEWIETFEWMHENGIQFFSDTMLANGEYNKNWGYALHLEEEKNFTYIAIIERSEF